MGRKDTLKDLFEMVEEGAELVDNNEELLSRLTGGGHTLQLQDGDMLREVKKQNDKVLIITETEKEYDKVSIGKENGNVVIGLDGKELVAEVPDDCRLKDVEANLNNNVLEVTIPREE